MTTAAMLAICLLAFAETTDAAEADSLPDNGNIAFSEMKGSIYTVEPDGSNLRELTGGTYPNWSPDGTELAFIRQDAEEADISVMSADGSNLNNLMDLSLTSGPSNSGPAWLPDGTKIASERDEYIYTMDSDGSNQTQLTKTAELSEQYPDWQPLTAKSRGMTVQPLPDTGDPSLSLVASALLLCGGGLFYAVMRRRM